MTNAPSQALAHGARLAACRAPDNVLAATVEERQVQRLRRRIRRWQRLRLIR